MHRTPYSLPWLILYWSVSWMWRCRKLDWLRVLGVLVSFSGVFVPYTAITAFWRYWCKSILCHSSFSLEGLTSDQCITLIHSDIYLVDYLYSQFGMYKLNVVIQNMEYSTLQVVRLVERILKTSSPWGLVMSIILYVASCLPLSSLQSYWS